MGPINRPKVNLYPLTGVIETNWLPFTFTMNWQLLAPGKYIFEKDEPICTVMPLPHNYLPEVEPEIYAIGDDEVLEYEHEIFRRERAGFLERLSAREPAAVKQAWQRHYFVGRFPSGAKVEDHVNKLRLKDAVDKTGQRPSLALPVPRAQSEAFPWADRHKLKTAPLQPDAASAHDSADEPKAAVWRFPQPKVEISPQQLGQYISGAQTTKNLDGRRRVVDGALVAAADNYPAECSPTDDLDFLLVDDVLDRVECEAFCEAYRSISGSTRMRDTSYGFWDGRIVAADRLIYKFLPQARRMRELCQYTAEAIGKFYSLDEPVYADTMQLACWPEGQHLQPHADSANPDGEPHGMPWRRFASVLYLNDDYEGGELYLTALNKIVRPKRGRLIAFTAGFHHEHAVLRVQRGTRYTMPAFFTEDEDRADVFLYS